MEAAPGGQGGEPDPRRSDAREAPGQDLYRPHRKGFDSLGYHFGQEGLGVARKTLEKFVERAIRLYEQEPGEPCGSSRLVEYVQRWGRWVGGGSK